MWEGESERGRDKNSINPDNATSRLMRLNCYSFPSLPRHQVICLPPPPPPLPPLDPPPSSWKIWKRKIKRLPAGADARSSHASAARAGATPQPPLAESRLPRDGMQLLVIGSQVGKLRFFIDVSSLSLSFPSSSFFLVLSVFILVFFPPTLLSRLLPSSPSSPHLQFRLLLS